LISISLFLHWISITAAQESQLVHKRQVRTRTRIAMAGWAPQSPSPEGKREYPLLLTLKGGRHAGTGIKTQQFVRAWGYLFITSSTTSRREARIPFNFLVPGIALCFFVVWDVPTLSWLVGKENKLVGSEGALSRRILTFGDRGTS
jgi:hypothetical protein